MLSRRHLLTFAMWGGVAGFGLSLAVHLTAILFPNYAFGTGTFLLHVGMFATFFSPTIVLSRLASRPGAEPDVAQEVLWDSTSRWEQRVMMVTAGYVALNFVFFMGGTSGGAATEAGKVRGFSGHWLVFYGASAWIARQLLRLDEDVLTGLRNP